MSDKHTGPVTASTCTHVLQTMPWVTGQQSLTICAMAALSSACTSVVAEVMSALREYCGAPYSLMICSSTAVQWRYSSSGAAAVEQDRRGTLS
jgi:hypothetical protein